jgi:hypothetical protein
MSEVETVTLRERVRERLIDLAKQHIWDDHLSGASGNADLADAILREFRLQPVAWGRVTEGGEVEGL